MHLEQKIQKRVEEYLQEPEKRKIHHIDILLPGHDGRFWIIDAASLGRATSGFRLALYFSVNQHSKRGKRVLQSIDVLDLFDGYEVGRDGLHLTYHKVSDNAPGAIAAEVTGKINALYPTIDSNQVVVKLVRPDNRTTVQ